MELLSVPFLLVGGGLMLLWIALKLLQEEEGVGHEVHVSEGLGYAVRTIIAADFGMSLDNTLAVAGVGRGHPGLIVVGLLVSISMSMISSLFISTLMNHHGEWGCKCWI